MLSNSLDPDQDLQSGFKLVTWYDVCCNIWGGDYVLVVKFSRGDYVLVVKFSGGDYVLVIKFMGGGGGGDFVHVYKISRGGGVVRIPYLLCCCFFVKQFFPIHS